MKRKASGAASDWLKIGFHAKREFPDYPAKILAAARTLYENGYEFMFIENLD